MQRFWPRTKVYCAILETLLWKGYCTISEAQCTKAEVIRGTKVHGYFKRRVKPGWYSPGKGRLRGGDSQSDTAFRSGNRESKLKRLLEFLRLSAFLSFHVPLTQTRQGSPKEGHEQGHFMSGHLKNTEHLGSQQKKEKKRMMHYRIKRRSADGNHCDYFGIASNNWRKGKRKPRNIEQLICSRTGFEVKHLGSTLI